MGLNDELEKTRNAIRIISGADLGSVDAAVDYLEDLCRRVTAAESRDHTSVASQCPGCQALLDMGSTPGQARAAHNIMRAIAAKAPIGTSHVEG
jgi:hypothetical protein